jgi:hypothetical protein
MSQQSEARMSDRVVRHAQIVPFERPQSDLQKAVQQRAQEAIEREREREANRRPPVWRRGLVLALATIPVVITFGAAVGFVGALRQYNSAILAAPAPASASTPSQASSPSSTTQQPDVVMLQPLSSSDAQPKAREPASTSQPAR